MSSDYYYRRTANYKKIRHYDLLGEHHVPMVHSAVLVDLKRISSDMLTFNATKLNSLHDDKTFDGPIDDIIIFAIAANFSNTEMFISNSRFYGFVLVPLDQEDSIQKDHLQLINAKNSIINHYDEVHIIPELQRFAIYPELSRLSFSEVFMINLKRRPERRVKMEMTLRELGIDYTYREAVDGKKLSIEILAEKGIKLMPEYEDPYHKRPMKMGEVGCFLSHYAIWQRMVEKDLQEVLVLEDDIKFEPYFREAATELMKEARTIGGFDLIYFGRKRLQDKEEFIEQSSNFVKVSYTYWTLGYVLTLTGAKKLLAAEPLTRLLPVDEFLPIMFDQHPNDTWKMNYGNRNLVAWSVNPLLLFPTHYTGEEGYISDTEDSKPLERDESEDQSLQNVKENILHHRHHDSSEF
jgi:collagen beta-1,O-galactosyltransferase